MSPVLIPRRYFAAADILIFLLIGAIIYAVVATGFRWHANFSPVTDIDLSLGALPRYSLFSAVRGLVAYVFSLLFTLVIGYAAAKSRKAERVLIPMIDILQSIPPLGFLPGLVLALIAIFPKTNTGLELVAIITVFTGQVWNMTFSFYSSVKSLPDDYHEASAIMGLNWWEKLWQIELPFSAVNLAWNSLMSMAGGWFFLSVSEAFTLGNHEYRLPGVGAYMAVAIKEGNTRAMIYGIVAMIFIIIALDFIIWHPILSWVRRFRLEEVPNAPTTEPLVLLALKESKLIRWIKFVYRRNAHRRSLASIHRHEFPDIAEPPRPQVFRIGKIHWALYLRHLEIPIWIASGVLIVFACIKLFGTLAQVPGQTWLDLLGATGLTFLRIMGALLISSLWAIPMGIWIGLSARRTRIAQPIIQVLASFPAPMLYPIALTLFFAMGMNLNWGSMFLMLLGVQWYVLFNVLAGALRISTELGDTLSLMRTSRIDRWKVLYLPSVFPALVTGWVTAAGGAWNASMVSEYIAYKGQTLSANGLGAMITIATERGDFPMLAASLTIMVVVVISFNRTVWSRVYALAQNRFRMDG